jgi:hypothetical protein
MKPPMHLSRCKETAEPTIPALSVRSARRDAALCQCGRVSGARVLVARWLAGCIVPGVAVLCVKKVERGWASEVVGWGHGKVKVGHITFPRS